MLNNSQNTVKSNNQISDVEFYYLLRRIAATLTVWNGRDLNIPAKPPVPINLNSPSNNLNPLYSAYDSGCCLIVAPVNLYDSKRTDWHALQAAHALVYHAVTVLGWDKIELTGLDTMVSRALVTALVLGATALRCTPTDRERQLVESLRESQPSWLNSATPPAVY